jgi:DNA-directed RNA polymerase sigma subunit (sigma70/sigma32)
LARNDERQTAASASHSKAFHEPFSSIATPPKKYRDILKQENADILLSNHVNFDDSVAKMATLKARQPGQPNPYVIGQDAVQRFLTILGECALATKASIGDDTPGAK